MTIQPATYKNRAPVIVRRAVNALALTLTIVAAWSLWPSSVGRPSTGIGALLAVVGIALLWPRSRSLASLRQVPYRSTPMA